MPERPGRVRSRLFLPSVISLQKTAVYELFCLQTDLHRLPVILIRAKIESLPFKSYVHPVFSVPGPEHAPETAGIILPGFSLLKDFHTGAVNTVQLLTYLTPVLISQAAAAHDAFLHERVLCHFRHPAAVTLTLPVYGALPVPPVCWAQSRQPAELPPGQLHSVMSVLMGAAATALHLSRFQVPGSHSLLISAVTPAQPAGPAILVLRPAQHSQVPEHAPRQVLGNAPPAGAAPGDAPAVRHGPVLQPLCIDKDFPSAVAAASPHSVFLLSPVRLFQHSQVPEALSRQILLICLLPHLSLLFLFFFFLRVKRNITAKRKTVKRPPRAMRFNICSVLMSFAEDS